MTIKNKLNLITGIVLSFTVLIMGFTVAGALEKKSVLSQTKDLNLLSQKLSLLIHETEKERGASAGFLGSKGKKFATIMQKQRSVTNKRVEELKSYLHQLEASFYPKALQENIGDVESDLQSLSKVRAEVSSFQISVKNEVKYYTHLNKDILDIVSLTAKLADTPELVKALTAYTNFLKSRERAGIERAVMSATFAKDRFSKGVFAKFVRLMAEEKAYMDAFLSIAPHSSVEMYKEIISSPVVAKVDSMRQIAITKANEGGFGVDSVVWFRTTTKKMNLLKEVDDNLVKSNNKLLSAIESEYKTDAMLILGGYILFAIVIFIIILTISRGVNRSVKNSLEKIECVVDNLDLTCSVVVEGDDEISHISKALHKMISAFKESVYGAQDVAVATTQENNKLRGVVDVLTTTGKAEEKKIESMNSLIVEVEQKLDGVEESMVVVTEDLDNIEEVLDVFIEKLSLVVESIESGSRQQQELANKVSELTEQAKNIKDVLEIISDIAEQTNLLALNAAIEAARAGEHGRGFAVVADEVRKLAERTQKSLSEISANVNLITQNVVEIAEDTNVTSKSMDSISNAAQELITSSHETKENLVVSTDKSKQAMHQTVFIATRTKELMENMNELVKFSEQNSGLRVTVEEAVDSLTHNAQRLQSELKKFKI